MCFDSRIDYRSRVLFSDATIFFHPQLSRLGTLRWRRQPSKFILLSLVSVELNLCPYSSDKFSQVTFILFFLSPFVGRRWLGNVYFWNEPYWNLRRSGWNIGKSKRCEIMMCHRVFGGKMIFVCTLKRVTWRVNEDNNWQRPGKRRKGSKKEKRTLNRIELLLLYVKCNVISLNEFYINCKRFAHLCQSMTLPPNSVATKRPQFLWTFVWFFVENSTTKATMFMTVTKNVEAARWGRRRGSYPKTNTTKHVKRKGNQEIKFEYITLRDCRRLSTGTQLNATGHNPNPTQTQHDNTPCNVAIVSVYQVRWLLLKLLMWSNSRIVLVVIGGVVSQHHTSPRGEVNKRYKMWK